MKKRDVKLVLSRETLHRLQDEDLSRAGGGKPTDNCGSVKTLCASCLCPVT